MPNSGSLELFDVGGVDLAIRYGVGPWDGCDNTLWLSSPMVVVVAPDLIKGRDVSAPEDLRDLPWIEEFGTSEGNEWLRKHGVDSGITGGFIQAPGHLMLDAARDGQGVAVTVKTFVQPDLDAGRLICFFEEARPGAGYHIVTRTGVQRAAVKAFVRWLKRSL